MSFNLIRNARVFFASGASVDQNTGAFKTTYAHTTSTLREIQVLDGLSLSQTSGTETVTLNEAGEAPIRGQRTFNTSLNPVDFSFSTYIRPQTEASAVVCEESVLWGALLSDNGSAWSSPTVAPANSNKHTLQKFALVIVMDESTFIIDNCVLTEASLDFGIDGITMVAWTGQGTQFTQVAFKASSITADIDGDLEMDAGAVIGATGALAKAKDADADYIANKLSLAYIAPGFAQADATGTAVAITGGSLTISNNVTFLTPATVGVVNKPIAYFAGTRSVTGTLSAYLRGAVNGGDTAQLIQDLKNSADVDDTPYTVGIYAGGKTSGTPYIYIKCSAAVVSIPDLSTDQIVSTTINFTGQGYAGTTGSEYFDITAENEVSITYNAAA